MPQYTCLNCHQQMDELDQHLHCPNCGSDSVTALPTKEREWLAALQDFTEAAIRLSRLWEDVPGDAGANNLYPFQHSFDEVTHSIIDWNVESQHLGVAGVRK